jgi:hypothetical protein
MIEGKAPRQTSEFGLLREKNPTLYWLAVECAAYIRLHFGEEPYIPSVFRNTEENAAAGGLTDTHTEWRAVDLACERWAEAWASGNAERIGKAWEEAGRTASAMCVRYRTGAVFPSRGAEPEREMAAAYAKPHGTAPHVHLQSAKGMDIAARIPVVSASKDATA